MPKNKKARNKSNKKASVSPSSKKASPSVKSASKLIWGAIGAVAVIIGLVMNLTLDVPEILRKWSILSTPLPFPQAATNENEILVIVTNFSGADGEAAAIRIYRALAERVKTADLQDVRIEWLPTSTPHLSEDAIMVGEEFYATLVIWGTADGYGVEPRYEIVHNKDKIKEKLNFGIYVATAPPSFSSYIVLDLPKEFEYLLLFSLGQLSYFGDDDDKALSFFSQALSLSLDDRARKLSMDIVHSFRGSIYRNHLKDVDAALNDYTRAIEINPSNPIYYSQRGSLLTVWDSNINLERVAKAVDDYTNAIRLDSNDAGYYLNRGGSYQLLSNWQAAFDDYSKAIDVNPYFAPAYTQRGYIYNMWGDYTHAEEDYTAVINILVNGDFYYNDYGIAEEYSRRGRFYINQRECDKAVDDLTHAIELNPNNLTNLNDRAVAYECVGMYQEALEDYSLIIDTQPNADTYKKRGWVYFESRNYDMAISDFKHVVKELEPDSAEAYLGLGQAYYATGLRREALVALQNYLMLVGKDADQDIIDFVQELRKELNK